MKRLALSSVLFALLAAGEAEAKDHCLSDGEHTLTIKEATKRQKRTYPYRMLKDAGTSIRELYKDNDCDIKTTYRDIAKIRSKLKKVKLDNLVDRELILQIKDGKLDSASVKNTVPYIVAGFKPAPDQYGTLNIPFTLFDRDGDSPSAKVSLKVVGNILAKNRPKVEYHKTKEETGKTTYRLLARNLELGVTYQLSITPSDNIEKGQEKIYTLKIKAKDTVAAKTPEKEKPATAQKPSIKPEYDVVKRTKETNKKVRELVASIRKPETQKNSELELGPSFFDCDVDGKVSLFVLNKVLADFSGGTVVYVGAGIQGDITDRIALVGTAAVRYDSNSESGKSSVDEKVTKQALPEDNNYFKVTKESSATSEQESNVSAALGLEGQFKAVGEYFKPLIGFDVLLGKQSASTDYRKTVDLQDADGNLMGDAVNLDRTETNSGINAGVRIYGGVESCLSMSRKGITFRACARGEGGYNTLNNKPGVGVGTNGGFEW